MQAPLTGTVQAARTIQAAFPDHPGVKDMLVIVEALEITRQNLQERVQETQAKIELERKRFLEVVLHA
jgi:hypothetical protein